ncbi:MAG: hypothetical protein MK171_05665 [Pirellulales bacterium]|nr:hypothetical protein [Pirellulales bacterium]
MKTNLKSGNAVVRLLLCHGEKIGMVGIVVCAAMLAWSGLRVNRLEDSQTPNQLSSKSARAEDKVDGFTYRDYPDKEKLIAKELSADEAQIKVISLVHFPHPKTLFNGPVLDPIALRRDPFLFTAEDVEAHGDFGMWATANRDDIAIRYKKLEQMREQERLDREEEIARERTQRDGSNPRDFGGVPEYGASQGPRERAGNRGAPKGPVVIRPRTGARLQGYEEISARSWITVLAQVPIQQQHQQYEDTLKLARGYRQNADIPSYKGYVVERAEVTDEGQGPWQKLDPVAASTIESEIETYPVNVPDVIDPRVNHPILTHPLPPLILREWDKRVSHSLMPLASELDPEEKMALQENEQDEEDPAGKEATEEDIFGDGERGYRDTDRDGRRGSGRFAGPPGASGAGLGEYGAGPGGMGMGMGMMGPEAYGDEAYGGTGGYGGGMMMGMMPGGYGGGSGSMGRGRGVTLDTYTWDEETSHLLLRFFDHSEGVLPGHRYRYRVRLVLLDVNHDVAEKYLDATVTERRGPKGSRYRYTEWSKPSGIASVPHPARVHLMSAKPAKETNFTVESKLELLVKALNNEFAAEVSKADFFIRGSVINLREKPTLIKAAEYDPEEDSTEFDLRTGITLLDFLGGEKLHSKNKDLFAPTRALLMDAAGKLFVQSELEDAETVGDYEEALEKQSDPRRQRYGSGGYGSGGYGAEEGFGGPGGYGGGASEYGGGPGGFGEGR